MAAEAKRAAYIVDGVVQERRWRLRVTNISVLREKVFIGTNFHVISISSRFFL